MASGKAKYVVSQRFIDWKGPAVFFVYLLGEFKKK